MSKINLYVDDLRDCPEGFVIARTIREAKRLIQENDIGILSLDNDMGNGEGQDGKDLANWFCENGCFAEKIYVHTDNPVERDGIYKSLLAAQNRDFISDAIEVYRYPCVPNKYTDKNSTP